MFVTRPYGWAMVTLLGLAAAGCGNLGVPAARFAFFDLGVAAPVDPPLRVALARVEVRAPTWLSTSAMQYRIEYRHPAEREAYSETRWVAEPAEMLGLTLDRALAPNSGAGGKCRLRVELDEFVQEFETAGASHAIIIARPSLISPRSDDVIAQSNLVIREQAPTPDAAGGVTAHRRAARRLANGIAAWIASLDSADRQGPRVLERCRQ